LNDTDIAKLSPRDIEMYADYLSLYLQARPARTNRTSGCSKITPTASCESSPRCGPISTIFSAPAHPRQHRVAGTPAQEARKADPAFEKDEMQKLLAAVQTGDSLTPRQAAFHR
jgi:hypothetical protein